MRALELLRIAARIIEKHGADAPVYVPAIIDESTVEMQGDVDDATPDAIRRAIKCASTSDTPDDLYLAIEAEYARIATIANAEHATS